MTKQEQLLAYFSEQVGRLYSQMIPSYREGYANYVFQTDKPDIQRRRLKNLEKIFKTSLDKPNYWTSPLTEEVATLLGIEVGQEAMQILKNGSPLACFGLIDEGDKVMVRAYGVRDVSAFQEQLIAYLSQKANYAERQVCVTLEEDGRSVSFALSEFGAKDL